MQMRAPVLEVGQPSTQSGLTTVEMHSSVSDNEESPNEQSHSWVWLDLLLRRWRR
jgi:hypothetical protein